MAKWWRDKAPGNAREVKARMAAGRYGLHACPDCSRLNGLLQRDDDDRCSAGVGCRRIDGRESVT